ncbi:hypothetical protein [Arthrobacter sp. ISL-5]|uniref:hypothetical protein n=1 Tax=Arthrobacter sp. ISL-5 TaxID=2819111 RepID=UPI001BEC6296|nr:hypothetical protein [Arthrobacter sp. ISL-5]MBT2555022.1 hypothetical protein [Arthrobacter sp. ISL-5]
MTENQWPQDGSLTVPPATQNSTAYGSGVSGSPASASKTDTAKEEAAIVAGQAAGAAQNVAGTAKAEAANVASEVKTNARDLLYQAKSDLTSQAGTQQQKVAQGLRNISGELSSMASASDQPGVASDLVRQAADRSQAIASWLDNRDPGSLLDEVKSFARQRPGAFLLIAAGAGVLAGRLGRSLQAGAPATGSATGTSVPRQPIQPPVAEGTLGAGAGEPLYDHAELGEPAYTVPAYGEPASAEPAYAEPPFGEPAPGEPAPGEPAYGEPGYGEPRRTSGTGPAPGQTLPGSSASGVPLRDDDPHAEGEGRHL